MSRNNNNKFVIPENVKEFSKVTYKKFKKHYGDEYDSKKERKKGYYYYLTDLLPETIVFEVKYGHINQDDVREAKTAIFDKIADPGYIKFLKKELKKGSDIENIKYLPIIIQEMLKVTEAYNNKLLAEDPNADIYKLTDLVELSQLILTKKLKKFEKADINNKALAFDCLSVIPCKSVLKSSQKYRIHVLTNVLYEHAKVEPVPYGKIVDIIAGEQYYPIFCLFSLLERKEKFNNLTEKQKELYVQITNWTFDTMEKKLTNETLYETIKGFVRTCKNDDAKGRGGERRFKLSTLSEVDYPRITKVVNKMILHDDSLKKYL